MRTFRRVLYRNLDGIILRENFIVSSIATIFVIRFFLKVTNYPELGGAGLHIAHLLWGGLFMLVALIVFMSFLGRGVMMFSSIVGGIGFGTFIDELGKFVTSDNNYFFQPTFAILYIIFILIYIISKALSNTNTITKDEYTVNALAMVAEAVMNNLDPEEKKRAIQYLKRSDQQDPLVKSLSIFFGEVKALPQKQRSLFSKTKTFLSSSYSRVLQNTVVTIGIIITLLLQSFYAMYSVVSVFILKPNISFSEQSELYSSAVSALFAILGAALLKKSRANGYRLLKISILVALLVTQPFIFYQEQLRALIGLAVNLFLLVVIDFALDQEENIKPNPEFN